MSTVALDIGGANIKAARADRACTLPFALWQRPAELTEALALAVGEEPFERLCVTMTGELCDCFEGRADGVGRILDAVGSLAGQRPVYVWSTRGRFVNPAAARQQPIDVAAANWHALACLLARRFAPENGLMIDIGSTTTDIIRLREARVDATALTDMDRLATGELVYVGVQRTPLPMLLDRIDFAQRQLTLMNECFAETADLFTLNGALPEDAQRLDTPDGRPRTALYAAGRILRTIGTDLDTHTADDARELADQFIAALVQRVSAAVQRVVGSDAPDVVFVVGAGEFLAGRVASEVLPKASVHRLSDTLTPEASKAACAHALLELSAELVD